MLVGTSAWSTAVPYNVGSSTSDAWGTGFSDVWTMTGDGVVTVTFTNHCATTGNNWENWQLLCGNSDYTPAAHDNANRSFQMRSDRWDDAAGSAVGFIVSDDYFTDFKTFQNEATVTLKIVRHGSTVNVNTSVTKDATTRTMTYVKTGLEGTLNFFLTQSLSYMEITAQSTTTTVAGETMTNAHLSFTDASITGTYNIAGEVGNMTWSGQWNATPSIDANTLRVGNMNDGTVALVGEAAGEKDIVTITFDLGVVQLSAKSLEFKVTDANGLVLVDEEFSRYDGTFTDGKNTFGFATSDFVSSKSDNPGLVAANKNTFTITFNYATSKISCSVVNTSGTVNKQIDMPAAAAAVATFAVRSNYGNATNAGRRCYFDNLKITTEIGNYAAASTTYTVKYKSGGVEIKDESTGRVGDVGDHPVLEAGDMETFYSNDGSKKYVYASDDASTTVIADGGTTVVTVNFTTYEKRNYTLNAVDNEQTVLGELATGFVYADAISTTVNTPWYVLYNGTLYNRNGNSTTFDVESNGQTTKLEYTATAITDVVFYAEGENLDGVTKVTNSIASNKGIARIPNETTFTTLGAGTYTVYIRAHAGNASGGTAIFKTGDVEFARKSFAGSTNNQDFNASFALLSSTDVKIKYDVGNTTGLDYIYVVKNSDDATISATIPTSGYGSIASAYALDCANLPAGLTAYQVTSIAADKVTLTQVTEAVAAGTGLILKGTAGSYNIPVAATGTDISATNKLKAAVTDTEIAADEAYILQTGQFHKVTAASTVPAGKAYLLATGGGARSLNFTFDATAIKAVEGEIQNGEFYNVAGQRVAQPTKGLYIVNGKKIVVK